MNIFPVTFNFEGQEFEASVHEIPPSPDKQWHVTINDEALIKRFGESFILVFIPHADKFNFTLPPSPGGKDFMNALIAGIKNYMKQ